MVQAASLSNRLPKTGVLAGLVPTADLSAIAKRDKPA